MDAHAHKLYISTTSVEAIKIVKKVGMVVQKVCIQECELR